MSSIFSLLLLFHLDRVVLIKGFEGYDFGECGCGYESTLILLIYILINSKAIFCLLNLVCDVLYTKSV